MELPYIRYTSKPFWLHRLLGAKVEIKDFVLRDDQWFELSYGKYGNYTKDDPASDKMQIKLNEAFLKMTGK